MYGAFLSSSVNLSKVKIFHTYRGNEFKNQLIDELINFFKITSSLNNKGCPYDNTVAEAIYKIFKTGFAINKSFDSLDKLKSKLADLFIGFITLAFTALFGTFFPVQFKKSHFG